MFKGALPTMVPKGTAPRGLLCLRSDKQIAPSRPSGGTETAQFGTAKLNSEPLMALVDDGDVVRGVGYVTIYAAYLEEEIEEYLRFLAPIEPVGKALRAPASSHQRDRKAPSGTEPSHAP